MIVKENTKEYFYLNEDSDAQCRLLYWMNQDLIVRETEQLWEVFCTKDASKIATLKRELFDCLRDESNKRREYEVVGILEKSTGRIYSPTIESILHLGKLDLLTLHL